ncbi:ABC transporter substrate-binding protein [Paenibacillus sp. YIM B09110]|uniref:ABC transporter substrate-binding protein n=1 Tax=Paenibacillus sp. YIM B09110 TaxID=3126102 RepID=UPI00301D2570
MEWPTMVKAWNQTQVKLLDIRHIVMLPGEKLQSYCLPANAFIFVNQGNGKLILDGNEVLQPQDKLIHGGKGASLHISSFDQTFDYYLLLYKPAPFEQYYCYRSRQPWLIRELLEPMHRQMQQGGEMNRLLATGMFYQFVHEQFRQLQLEGAEVAAPELSEQIADYLKEHYRESISMETLVGRFHYSSHYLSRIFRRKYGCSPLEFLVRSRMNRAKSLLAEGSIPIRDIADSVGYTDMYYFSRLFKKQIGITPAQFKMHCLAIKSSNRPKFTPESFIVPQVRADYIVNSDNHYQQNSWGVDEMKASFKPSFAVTLLFSLSLLLAACGGAAGNEEKAVLETRKYTDALGREVEIPVQPEHAVIVTYGGYLLPLGLKPVGADQGTLDQYPDEMKDITSIGEGTGNEEAIVSLQPDIIIMPDYHDAATFDKYQKIAPTIAVAWGGDPDVINTLRTMGDIMNRKQEAEAWITKFEEKLELAREKIDMNIEPGSTAVSFIVYDGMLLLGGKGGTLGKLIYEDLGFQMPEQFNQYADGGAELSLEALVDRPADYFFTQMTEEEMGPLKELFSEPLYQAVPAIKSNHIINVSRDKWNYGPYRVEQGVDELVEQITQFKK